MPPSKFDRRHCLLFTTANIKTIDTIPFINDNLESLTARGDKSKILILDGSHGDEDGNDGMNKVEALRPNLFYRNLPVDGNKTP